jgi:hypothetical protein
VEREDLSGGLRLDRLASGGGDQAVRHRLVQDIVISEPQQMRRIGERRQLLPRGGIGVEPGFDFAQLRGLQLAIQIGDETIVTEPPHPSYSYPPPAQPRAGLATRSGRAPIDS